MKINKSLNIDLNIISPQKHIRIHEGDVDSVDILIGVTVDDESVDLTGVTIKYDATINNYLAEQDADGSVVDDKISIPVTQNMTAMSGLLLIDVRMIQSDQILFTQTICATVEKAVVNGSTYIDFDKVTIIQRMNALEDKMDYIEELVENFDTSKLIVSVNRPPEGAPAEVDVDLLRVGDTWILSGANIVYKLVEARYNYQPVPSAEPYHKFIWQPLNERFGVGNTEPPASVTYQAVIYTINEVQWSWLPVPEYFKGDHYQMQVGVDDPTYYICKSASMPSTGVCSYTWREEGGAGDAYTKAETNALLADKMDLLSTVPADITKETPDYTSTNFTKLSNNQLFLFEPLTAYDRSTIELWNKINSNSAIRISNKGVPFRRYKTCFVDGDLSAPSNALFMADAVDPEILYDVKTSSEYGPIDGCMFYLRDSRRGYMYESQYWIHIDGRISSRNRIRPNGDISVTWSQFNDFVTDAYTKAETNTLLSAKENISNKVTSLSSSSTDSQYPTAKCVYDIIGDIESLLAEV